MEYYSAIKRNAFESVLVRCMNTESIIQSEVTQKEKKTNILTHNMESRKMVLINLCERQLWRRRHREQTWVGGWRRGWDEWRE